MDIADATQAKRLGAFPFVVAGLSFIPLIGVLFGLVAIGWGIAAAKRGGKTVAMVGVGGIAFTFVLYGTLFYLGFAKRGGVFDDARLKLAQANINTLVPSIELYKTQNGRYPESLKELQESLSKGTFVFVYDPSSARPGEKATYFYYKRVGEDHYYLRGVGPDGKPFTADDVLPQIPSGAETKIGLLTQRVAP